MKKEQQLLSDAHKFDRSALAEIYDLYHEELYRYAFRQLGDQQMAEDCVSETFNRFLNALRNGKGPEQHLRAYLFRIAHNWITDQFRRTPPPEVEIDLLPISDSGPGLEERLIGKQQKETVRAMLTQLTPEQRQVIVLKYLEGWKNQEIAAAVGKPIGAVKSLQHRGLAAMQRIMAKEVEIK